VNRYALRHLLICLALLGAGAVQVAEATCTSPTTLVIDIQYCGALSGDQGPGWDVARALSNTAAINSALAAGNTILIPAGLWLVNSFEIPAGKTVLTGGLATILKKVDLDVAKPIVKVTGSNVRVDSFTAEGQVQHVAMPQESMHALEISNAASGASAITNVTLGDITGNNIAGDVVYIGGIASGAATVSNVTFGTITGSNVQRSMMSIVGGTDISGTAVTGGNCGYTTLDIEPNQDSQTPDRISIGLVQGGKFQLAAAPGAPQPIGTVQLGTLILDSGLQTNSMPAYPYYDLDVGIMASHWTMLRIGTFHASNKHWSAFFSPAWGQLAGQGSVVIGNYVGSGNGATNQAYGEFECNGCSWLKVASGSTQLYPSKPLFTGATTTSYDIENFTFSGGLGSSVNWGTFKNVTIDATGVAYLMSYVHNTIFDKVQLTYSSGTKPIFFWASTDNVLVDSNLAATLQSDSSSGNNTLIRTVTQ